LKPQEDDEHDDGEHEAQRLAPAKTG